VFLVRTTLAVLAAAALFAPAAAANDVARVAVGSEIRALVAGPEGGAWIGIYRRSGAAIGRAGADGSFRTTGTDFVPRDATIGPDGQAWFIAGGDRLARADTAGGVSLLGPFDTGDDELGGGLAIGPDGAFWTGSYLTRPGLVRITPQGAPAGRLPQIPKCRRSESFHDVVRAADGVVWASDHFCDRLVRVRPDGTSSILEVGDSPEELAPDAAGGVWYAAFIDGFGGHVDAAGQVTRIKSEEIATDVAVAPDGGVWFALGRCAIARLNGTALEFRPTTIPAERLAFDPAGGLWLASHTRLVHASVDALGGGRCDDRPPGMRVAVGRRELRGRISLAALRRTGGLRVSVREPAVLSAGALLQVGRSVVGSLDPRERVITAPRGGAVRVPVSRLALRDIEAAVAAGRSATISAVLSVTDSEGNSDIDVVAFRVTP
jgi:streptogramin lyase